MWNLNVFYNFTILVLSTIDLKNPILNNSIAMTQATVMPVNEFITWDFLGTMAGAVAATTLIVQFLKIPLDKVWKIHTRYVVYFIAFFLLFFVELFTGNITFEHTILIMLNAIIVTMAAMGTYEITFKQVEDKN
ncbi:MAG: hypothetical protein WCD89_00085 [Anaerocolumna sp.]